MLKGQRPDSMFEIETLFVFHKSRLYTKDGRIKKLDTSNRIKPCHDAISMVLGLDDSRFNLTASKVYCDLENDEQTIVVVKPSELKGLDQIKKELKIY